MGATIRKRRATSPAKRAPVTKHSCRQATKTGRKQVSIKSAACRRSKSTSRTSRTRSRSRSTSRSRSNSRSNSDSRSYIASSRTRSKSRSRSRSTCRPVNRQKKATPVKVKTTTKRKRKSDVVNVQKELNNSGRRVTRRLSSAAMARGIDVEFDSMVDRTYARRNSSVPLGRNVPVLPLQLVNTQPIKDEVMEDEDPDSDSDMVDSEMDDVEMNDIKHIQNITEQLIINPKTEQMYVKTEEIEDSNLALVDYSITPRDPDVNLQTPSVTECLPKYSPEFASALTSKYTTQQSSLTNSPRCSTPPPVLSELATTYSPTQTEKDAISADFVANYGHHSSTPHRCASTQLLQPPFAQAQPIIDAESAANSGHHNFTPSRSASFAQQQPTDKIITESPIVPWSPNLVNRPTNCNPSFPSGFVITQRPTNPNLPKRAFSIAAGPYPSRIIQSMGEQKMIRRFTIDATNYSTQFCRACHYRDGVDDVSDVIQGHSCRIKLGPISVFLNTTDTTALDLPPTPSDSASTGRYADQSRNSGAIATYPLQRSNNQLLLQQQPASGINGGLLIKKPNLNGRISDMENIIPGIEFIHPH